MPRSKPMRLSTRETRAARSPTDAGGSSESTPRSRASGSGSRCRSTAQRGGSSRQIDAHPIDRLGDERIARELRETGRPVLLAINKTDDKRSQKSAMEFFQLGFDPVWFGIIIVCVVEIGLISPPVGMNMFVLKTLLPEVSTGTVFSGVLPFMWADVLRLAILVAFPWISLWLPSMMR